MARRVFIIHGWSGYPEEGWFPWLKNELEKRKFQVEVPKMPNSDNPKIEAWVSYLSKIVKKADKNTYFIGHSIGCQTILRYLETINGIIGGTIFVAGWFRLTNLETEEEKEIAKPWLEREINFEKVKKATKNCIAIFSDNDPYVPLEDSKTFKQKLNAKIIIEKNKGHFSGSDNVKELPVVLDELLKLVKN